MKATATRRTKGRGPADLRRGPAVKPKPAREAVVDDGRFRVLIAVHRPRFRSRAERAVNAAGWEIRSLLNKEDPIGLLNQRTWQILILSDDFGRQKSLGLFQAAQRFRPKTRIIGVFEDEESAAAGEGLCDASFAPPWKSLDVRASAGELHKELTGHEAVFPAAHTEGEE